MYSKIEIFLVNTSREKLGRIEKQKERNKEARDIVLIIIIYHIHAIKENLEGEKNSPTFIIEIIRAARHVYITRYNLQQLVPVIAPRIYPCRSRARYTCLT